MDWNKFLHFVFLTIFNNFLCLCQPLSSSEVSGTATFVEEIEFLDSSLQNPIIEISSQNSIGFNKPYTNSRGKWEYSDGTEFNVNSTTFSGSIDVIFVGQEKTVDETHTWSVTCVSHHYPTKWVTSLDVNKGSPREGRQQERWQLNPLSQDLEHDGPFVSTMNLTFTTLHRGFLTCQSLDIMNTSFSSTINIYIRGTNRFVPVRHSLIRFNKTHMDPIPCLANGIEDKPELRAFVFNTSSDNETQGIIWERYPLNSTHGYDNQVGFRFHTTPDFIGKILNFTCFFPQSRSSDQTFPLLIPGNCTNKLSISYRDGKDPFPGKFCRCYDSNNQAADDWLQVTAFTDTLNTAACASPEECDFLSNQQLNTKEKLSGLQRRGTALCKEEHTRGLEPVRSYFFVGLDDKPYVAPDENIPIEALMSLRPVEPAELYRDRVQEFSCSISNFLLWPNIKFGIKRHENEGDEEEEDIELLDSISLNDTYSIQCNEDEGRCLKTINVTLHRSMTAIYCFSPWHDSIDWFNVSMPLKILTGSEPTIETPIDSHLLNLQGESKDLECVGNGDPEPEFEWEFPNEDIEGLVKVERFNRFRYIIKFPPAETVPSNISLEGHYTCRSQNEFGNASQVFVVEYKAQIEYGDNKGLTSSQGAAIAAASLVVLMVMVVLGSMWKRYKFQKKKFRTLTQQEISDFRNGTPRSSNAAATTAGADSTVPEETTGGADDPSNHSDDGEGSKKAESMPFDMIIDKNDLIIARDSILGEGEFGSVFRGFFQGIAVAVKTTKEKAGIELTKMFLAELKIMAFIGVHPHIVKFYGAEISGIKKGHVFGCFELSPLGNLESYLRREQTGFLRGGLNTPSHRNSFTTAGVRGGELTMENKISYCQQIADAMEHLENLKIIHGDLATRNILVFRHNVVKLSDFGLSKRLYNYALIYKKRMERCTIPLPVAWMSLESLRNFEFSTKSDVWSFGVTAWEIFNMAQIPFPNFSWQEVINFWEQGHTLRKPIFATNDIHAKMLECWIEDPAGRPLFGHLKSFFNEQFTSHIERRDRRDLQLTVNVTITNPHTSAPAVAAATVVNSRGYTQWLLDD